MGLPVRGAPKAIAGFKQLSTHTFSWQRGAEVCAWDKRSLDEVQSLGPDAPQPGSKSGLRAGPPKGGNAWATGRR